MVPLKEAIGFLSGLVGVLFGLGIRQAPCKNYMVLFADRRSLNVWIQGRLLGLRSSSILAAMVRTAKINQGTI